MLSLGASALLGACFGFFAYAYSRPFPQLLEAAPAPSVQVFDRHGHLLAEVRPDGRSHTPIAYEAVPQHLIDALVAAEDHRFFAHPGVDPLAIARAFGSALVHRRWVSGASTLTQQLARRTFRRPRTLAGKLREAALALRIEQSWSKQRILEAYLNRVEFGPQLVGVAAAARAYFDKPVARLSLSEAASLVALVRGPSYYHPERHPERLRRSRDRILERIQRLALSAPRTTARAKLAPLRLAAPAVWPGAHHWVRRVAQRGAAAVHSTLDGPLQQRIETLVRARFQLQPGAERAAAVLVVDNASAEVRAYVGSPDYLSPEGGQNDGVTARRQPGSTLKPFIYAAAMQQLGVTAASVLPDLPLELRELGSVYAPRNYDHRFHGPVRLREALANSLNVPAVHTAARLGPSRVLSALHRFGFDSLDRSPEHYGAALALGNGEVTLQELAAAYSALARGGDYLPLRSVRGPPRDSARSATTPEIAALLLDILSDDSARSAAFGRHGPLEFPFDVAVKTGTSKGSRDNWTVGTTAELTVAVWVGHFDGSPMPGASGVSGAAPLFHSVMLEAMSAHPKPRPLYQGRQLQRAEICPLSGLRAGRDCPSRLTEQFISGTLPVHTCDWHRQLWLLEGMRASSDCPGAERRRVEVYPARYLSWARATGRPASSPRRHPRCEPRSGAPSAGDERSEQPVLLFPKDGAVFELDASLPPAGQQLVLRASSSNHQPLWFLVNGQRLGPIAPPYRYAWPLALGQHEIRALDSAGRTSAATRFEVRSAH